MTDSQPDLSAVPNVEESFEAPLSEEDQADLEALVAEPPTYHTLLQIWREILQGAQVEKDIKIGPAWASRITSMYARLTYQDMGKYRDLYFGKIEELLNILLLEIEDDEDCLKPLSAVSDINENTGHYKNLLLLWQQQVLLWELEWDYEDPDAAIELAAISECHKLFFGEQGLVSYLDNINFQFDEQDKADLAAALDEFREGHSE